MHASHATAPTYKLVLLRHGESEFNAVNKFCGWIDADLTATGEAEALSAGQVLAKEGYTFDIAFSSVLKRAVRTLWSVLRVLDLVWIPVTKVRSCCCVRSGCVALTPAPGLAPERAPLRRAARTGQGGDCRQVRRGPGAGVAPLV